MKKEEKEIEACSECLSLDLDFTPGGASAWLTDVGMGPVGGHPVCKICKKMVLPIVFKSREEYEKAKKELGR